MFHSPFDSLFTVMPSGSWIVSGLLAALSWNSWQSVELEHSSHVCGLGAAVPILMAFYAVFAVFLIVAIALTLRWMCR